VFLNLLVNAVHAIPAGHADDHEVRVTTRRGSDGDVEVAISDTGSGMTPQTLERLFTPFFTTKAAGVGTGLGLAICHRIITDLGGRIEVTSQLGTGSTFTVHLQASSARVVPEAAPAHPAPAALRRGRVLIVDDEALLAEAIRRMLSSDHDATSTTKARDVIDRIAAGERYDAIVCDLMMPEVTGMDFYDAIFASAPEQARKIIFMTGGAFAPRARDFLESVPNARLEKPFDKDQLLLLIDDLVA
jgi:CheY-like chemotaxis protein